MAVNILHGKALCHDCIIQRGVKGFCTISVSEELGLNHGVLSGQLFKNAVSHHDKRRRVDGKGPKHSDFILMEGKRVICDFHVSTEMIAANVTVMDLDIQASLNAELIAIREGRNPAMRK